MKILSVIGSAENGNTTEILRYFKSEILKNNDFEFEDLYLSDYPIGFCTGCHNCIVFGENACPHYKEVRVLEQKILNSDVLILASPGYMFSVTGIMKNFLDHVAYNCHRPKYFGKKIFYLSNCTKWQNYSVITPMASWGSGAGFTSIGRLFTDMLPFPLTEKELDKLRKVIGKAVSEFERKINSTDIKPDFGSMMVFRAFRTMSSLAPDIMKADKSYMEKIGAYTPGKKWFIDVKIPFFMNFMANSIEKNMKKTLASMIDSEKLKESSGLYRNKL